MAGAALLPGRAEPFAPRFLGALHHTAGGDEILHTGKAGDVWDCVKNDQGQNLPDPRHGLETRAGRDIVRLGRAGKIECHLAQEVVVGINEGHIYFDRLAYAGVGKVLFHALPVGFVRQLLADLRHRVY